MKFRKFVTPTIYALVIFTLSLMLSSAPVGNAAPEAEVTLQDMATKADISGLVEQIQFLEAEVAKLHKQIKALIDVLGNFQTPNTTPIAATTVKPKLRSPRQIDRTPVREEKHEIYLAKIAVLCADDMDGMGKVYSKLITTPKKSEFVLSLRAQLILWCDGESSFPTPMSTKQAAWAAYMMVPSEYPNPKTIKELYPTG